MRRALWLALAGVAAIAVGFGLYALVRAPEVTTSSPAAAAEYMAAQEARMKRYQADVITHLERALELDPDFVAAKVVLSDYLLEHDPERSGRLLGEASAADLERLTPREQLVVRRSVALRKHKVLEADALVDQYLAEHPTDTWAVQWKADSAWNRGDREVAAREYRRLLELNPNWAIAYNMLGYLAMAEGRFDEAEGYFLKYRFIAPDQANPHDSLGELLIVRGRYDEASASFSKALAIRSDFLASREHLIFIAMLKGDPTAVKAVLEQSATIKVADGDRQCLACFAAFAEARAREAWKELLEQKAWTCPPSTYHGSVTVISHLAACKLGELATAEALEKGFEQWAATSWDSAGKGKGYFQAMLLHMQGVRLAASGELEEAASRLRQADELLDFGSASFGTLKLTTELALAEVLLALHRDPEAQKKIARVEAVNPTLVTAFRENGLQHVGVR